MSKRIDMMENLIVCGCSFTQGHFLSKTETWGGYTANKMNLKLHNIAIGGMGNEWISHKTISYFLNNKDLLKNSIVMIGWSEPGRLMGTFENGNGYTNLVTIRPMDFVDVSPYDRERNDWPDDDFYYHGYVKKHYKHLGRFFNSYSYCLYKSYYSIYMLKQFLESHNIPYLFFDAIGKVQLESIDYIGSNNTNDRYDYSLKYINHSNESVEITEMIPEWMIETILNDKITSEIFDTPNYIQFNGMSMITYMFDYGFDELTNGNSGHPNSIASEIFSNMIIREYEKLYNK